MSQYDPTLKALVETIPADWLALLNKPRQPVEAIDADIATVSGAADKVLRVGDPASWLMHVEFHAGHDGVEQPSLYHVRNALLDHRHQLPVLTLVVILKPDADSPHLSGERVRQIPGGRAHDTFGYEVCRVWQLDPEMLLRSGAGLLPLVPISAVTPEQVSAMIPRMQQRMTQLRVKKKDVETLWDATNILMGLRFSAEDARQFLQGVRGMKESTTYQAIIEEGRHEGRQEGRQEGQLLALRTVVRNLCEPRLGQPDAATIAALEAIADVTRLHDLVRRASNAASWQDLLNTSTPPRRSRRRGNA